MTTTLPPRIATLVLVDSAGRLLGALPPLQAETPWWNHAEPLVQAAAAGHGIGITVLRLITAERPHPPGGAVGYLAELNSGEPRGLLPWGGTLDEHPLRMRWARPGGPRADLAWAREALHRQGLAIDAEPRQVRSWHLSSVWCLPPYWLKAVPPFFAHEGPLLAALQDESVPRLLAHDQGRMLLAPAAGGDRYDAPVEECAAMVDLLVDLQQRWAARVGALLALGLADWRAPAFARALRELLPRIELPADDRATLQGFEAGLAGHFVRLAACGLPDTLVHGDFHPGNFVGDGRRLTLIDWGDAGIGHPLLDQSAMLTPQSSANEARLRAHWAACWRRWHPRADIELATRLAEPLAALRRAIVYQRFVDAIEPAERAYHRDDVADFLRLAAYLIRSAPR
jgi:Ser/Thr protein kinase RdoA (MazF antagonist)